MRRGPRTVLREVAPRAARHARFSRLLLPQAAPDAAMTRALTRLRPHHSLSAAHDPDTLA